MRIALRKPSLQIDDYLDLLNLATRLGDQKWQEEIIRKLENLQANLAEISK
ncbi:hypothetical protein [Paenibacillus segetis]|uniref:Uncharacterized protein n=1 Tax=Paenibacillus segetis TaxID=1325360 RepID=A0ABQ1YU44_9BACL|nr:hypothetical protein [Paenibacillus segetis]GGH37178.1 hypothetical protein GCM10008013_44490 [Paenibacillus segetis]